MKVWEGIEWRRKSWGLIEEKNRVNENGHLIQMKLVIKLEKREWDLNGDNFSWIWNSASWNLWFLIAQLLFSWNRIIRCWIHVQGFQIKITKTDCRAVWKRFFKFEFFGKYGCCLCRTMVSGIVANFCSDFFVQIGRGSPAFMGQAMSAVELQRRTNNFDLTHLKQEKNRAMLKSTKQRQTKNRFSNTLKK